MAQIIGRPKSPSIRVSKFLGVNTASGVGQLKPGEASDMVNFFITPDGALEKRWAIEADQIGVGNWLGYWDTLVNGSDEYFAQDAAGSNNFWWLDGTGTWVHPSGLTHVGSACNIWSWRHPTYGDTVRVCPAGAAPVYLEGASMTSHALEPYLPVVATATPPAGGGTDLEPLNLLTQGYRQRFSGNGTIKTFVARTTLPSGYFVTVFVDGLQKLAGDATYPWTFATKTLTFTGATAPSDATNNVEIWMSKTGGGCDAGTPISRCTGSTIYGGAADSRAWVWGDSANPNRLYYSGVNEYGVPDDTYWPSTSYADIPDPITDAVRLYDRLIIFSASRAFYAAYSPFTDASGLLVPDYPVLPLSDSVGQICPGQTLLINNQPVTVSPSGIYRWASTQVRDERNAIKISERIDATLLYQINTGSVVKTMEWPERNEAWFCFGINVAVWNYKDDIWYYLQFYYDITGLWLVNGMPKLRHNGVCTQPNLSETPAALDLGVYQQDLYWTSDSLDFGRPADWKFLDGLWLETYSNQYVVGMPLMSASAGTVRFLLTGSGEQTQSTTTFDLTGPRQMMIKGPKSKFRRLTVEIEGADLNDCVVRGFSLAAHVSGNVNTSPAPWGGAQY